MAASCSSCPPPTEVSQEDSDEELLKQALKVALEEDSDTEDPTVTEQKGEKRKIGVLEDLEEPGEEEERTQDACVLPAATVPPPSVGWAELARLFRVRAQGDQCFAVREEPGVPQLDADSSHVPQPECPAPGPHLQGKHLLEASSP